MAQTHTRIWIHATFSKKNRIGVLKEPFATALHKHILGELSKLECKAVLVNGYRDHVHLLFQIPAKHSVSTVIQSVKGESSHWVNAGRYLKGKFAWQGGFAAFSVSESVVDKVRAYIQQQARHHAKKSFQEELDELLKRHGLPPAGKEASR